MLYPLSYVGWAWTNDCRSPPPAPLGVPNEGTDNEPFVRPTTPESKIGSITLRSGTDDTSDQHEDRRMP